MILRRCREIMFGIRWACRFANPIEILATRHLFRRKRSVVVEQGGMQMLIDSQGSDAQAVTEVLLDGMYDDAIRTAASGRPAFRYLNLGANIGAFDVRVFQLLGEACPTIEGAAIEMNPASHARLLVNLELNRLHAVRTVNAAAWNESGTTHVRLDERNTGQTCAGTTETSGSPVPLLAWGEIFRSYCPTAGLDLVKIDIEGAEEKVVPMITGADAAMIRYLVIETHTPEAHRLVSLHLDRVGFRKHSEQPGDGSTHLQLWQSRRSK